MAETLRTAVAVAAVALISIGCGMIYMPAGLIAAGALLLAGSVIGALRAR